MKNSIFLLSIAVTLLCGFLLYRTSSELNEARARVAEAESKQKAVAAEVSQQQKRNQKLQARLHDTRVESGSGITIPRVIPGQTGKADESAKPLTGLAKLFRDQAMKEALRAETKFGAARNVTTLLNAGLAQQLNLNEDQTSALRELLTQKASVFWDRMLVPMMTGEVDDADMASAGRAIKQALDEKDAQLRGLLGENGYNLYQWYEKTQPDRDEVNQFGAQMSRAGQDLPADLQGQLFTIMTDERAHFKFQYELGDPSKLDYEHWYDNFTEDKINAYAQDMAQLNDRVVQRAQGMMSPEQAARLKDFLSQQLLHAMVTAQTTTATFGKR